MLLRSRAFSDVRQFGATGDGKTLDTDAVNARSTLRLPPAEAWFSFLPEPIFASPSALKSHIHLHLEQGSTILAADSPKPGETTGYNGGTYDAAEPNTAWDALPGLRPQPLAQLAHLGRRHSRHQHHRPRPDLRQRALASAQAPGVHLSPGRKGLDLDSAGPPQQWRD